MLGFSMEGKTASKINLLHQGKICKCPSIPGSYIPRCQCRYDGISPLLQVRWKRLVIDEGHVSASLDTILTPFVKTLNIEKRWIVTGTPTSNLLGLSLGEKNEEEIDTRVDDEPQDIPFVPAKSPSPGSSGEEEPRQRVWKKHDREDLNKLGKMVTHFIAAPPFFANSKLMKTHVIDPLLSSTGPFPGAIKVLNQVMESVMFRHR
jgi:hypothetical protein